MIVQGQLCRRLKVKCTVSRSGTPCSKCKKHNLVCVLMKNLQSQLKDERKGARHAQEQMKHLEVEMERVEQEMKGMEEGLKYMEGCMMYMLRYMKGMGDDMQHGGKRAKDGSIMMGTQQDQSYLSPPVPNVPFEQTHGALYGSSEHPYSINGHQPTLAHPDPSFTNSNQYIAGNAGTSTTTIRYYYG